MNTEMLRVESRLRLRSSDLQVQGSLHYTILSHKGQKMLEKYNKREIKEGCVEAMERDKKWGFIAW